MARKTLFVAKTETFIVKGLEAKLQGVGVDPVFSSLKLQEVEEKSEGADLVILYTDDEIKMFSQTMTFLKELCTGKNVRILVVGTKEEHEIVAQWIPVDFQLPFCERPLNIDRFLNIVEKFFTDEGEQDRKKSILIVDDDVQYMSMIMDWLKDNYRVSVVNSGLQAINWLATNHPDLILLDYEMPITTGPQVLKRIKSNPDTADIPVIFLTGKNEKESIMQVMSLRPAGYLLKAIDKQGLLEKISGHFLSRIIKDL